MLVKICGIQTPEAVAAATDAGADFIGFVFAESRRKINPVQARHISRMLPGNVKKVGVFVNESIENMIEISTFAGLDYIQLHGDEPATVAKQLPLPVIKAFPADIKNKEKIENYPCDYYLIDTPAGKYRGGTGKTFDWRKVDHLDINREKLILAGGLTPKNVRAAIDLVKPAGVDVSSGVETEGKKDAEKIREFILEAKGKGGSYGNLYNA